MYQQVQQTPKISISFDKNSIWLQEEIEKDAETTGLSTSKIIRKILQEHYYGQYK